ncbi:MAG TPA: hypothetical protein VKV74_14500 [Bryobacteraceae bacterium]|nr:hypothetical protein [Bryobacteraceae bacterium]
MSVFTRTSIENSNAEPPGAKDDRFWRSSPLLAAVISLLVAAAAAYNRPPWSDEGWFSSASYNLARNGAFATTIVEPASTGLTRIDQHTYWVMPLYLLCQALWYRIFPASLFSTRAFNMALIPLAIWGFYIYLSRLKLGARPPKLAACLLALSFIFIDNAAFARPDFLCLVLGIWSFASYLLLREGSAAKALFIANTLAAASVFTHPNGILHFFGLWMLALWYDGRRFSKRDVAVALAPYVLFTGLWLRYVLEDFPAFQDQMLANGIHDGRWTSTLNPLLIVWNETVRYLVAFGLITRGVALTKSLALLAYLASVIGCLGDKSLRNSRSIRFLLGLLAVYFVIMSVFNQKLTYYLIHIVPVYIALLAVWCVHLWEVHPRARWLVRLGLVLLVSVETGGILLKSYVRSYLSSERGMIQYLRANSVPSDRIVGSAAMIYATGFDPRLRDDLYLGIKSGRAPDIIVINSIYRDVYAGWSKQRPEDMREIYARLSAYRLAYQNGEYDVYFLKKAGS